MSFMNFFDVDPFLPTGGGAFGGGDQDSIDRSSWLGSILGTVSDVASVAIPVGQAFGWLPTPGTPVDPTGAPVGVGGGMVADILRQLGLPTAAGAISPGVVGPPLPTPSPTEGCAANRRAVQIAIKAGTMTRAAGSQVLKAMGCGPLRKKRSKCPPKRRRCRPRRSCRPRRRKAACSTRSCAPRRKTRCRKTRVQAAFARMARQYGGRIPKGARLT